MEAIWYCLHLPRTLFDTIDISPKECLHAATLDAPHEIFPFPIEALGDDAVASFLLSVRPALILYPDDAASEAEALAKKTKSVLPPTPFSQLSPSMLRQHWESIAAMPIPVQRDRTLRPPPWTPPSAVAPLLLPTAHYTQRAFLDDGQYPDNIGPQSVDTAFQFSAFLRERLEALVLLLSRGPPDDEFKKTLEEAQAEVKEGLQWPVVIGMSGVSPSYKRASGRGASELASDARWEALAVQSVVTHRASAANALGVLRPEVDDDSFRILCQLEEHCAGDRPQPLVIWKILTRLGKSITRALGHETVRLLRRASSISAFTNFPIGLAILPGHTAPLSCSVPVSLLPVQPLTRCLQHELVRWPIIYLRKNLRVLIAECLSHSDPIRPHAMFGWKRIQEIVQQQPDAVCDIVEVSTPEQLRNSLSAGNYQVLLLSAHGRYLKEHNLATLVIGDKPALGVELGPMPPLVILSACHTAPRARGAVTVADLLLANGAVSVLGTLVPIDVRRDTTLMMRLFTYVMETIQGREANRSFDQVWHRVAATNAVAEVITATPKLSQWATEGTFEESALTEFMMRRSKGRLRRGHIYEDTEALLVEIANERGFGEHLRATLRSQRYIPESLLYVLLGRPDRIVLADPSIDALMEESSP
ncbi:CHAT domain-containing protein [Corallococcus sp. AB038B]|nr:CHAT domain-containing protein [Corallococcus sp. AB038B]